jgi:hypothetical protein
MTLLRHSLAALLALGLAAPLAMQAETGGKPAELAITGHVEHELHLSAAELGQLPQTAVDVSFQTGHGPQSGHFTGPLLWDVVQKAGITDEAGSKVKHHLQHAVLAISSDGYTVAIAIGEIDPDFEGKSVILALDDGGVRLIVPQDELGGRDVHDVVRIEVD